MNVLIACEESQRICAEMRRGGIGHFPVIFKRVVVDILSGISAVMFYRCLMGIVISKRKTVMCIIWNQDGI